MDAQPRDAVDDASPEVLAAVATALWGVLAELEDPDSEMTATTVTKRRIEGAALSLGAAVGKPPPRPGEV